MQFGFTLKPEHTIERTLALTRRAEAAGLRLRLAVRLARPVARPVSPADADGRRNTTRHAARARASRTRRRASRRVTASLLATLRRDRGGRMDLGIGRGDSARRVLGKPPTTMATSRRPSTSSAPSSRAADRVRGHRARLPVDDRLDAARLGRRLRPDGAGADRPRRRRRDPPARRPGPHPLVRRPGARGGRRGRTRPGVDQGHGRGAGPRRATATSCRERARWFPALVCNHVVDLVNQYPREQLPPALTGYVRDREGYDYHHHAEVGSGNAAFVERRGDRPLLRPRRRAEDHVRKLRELADAGVDQFNLYLMNGDEEEQLDAYGREVIPALARPPDVARDRGRYGPERRDGVGQPRIRSGSRHRCVGAVPDESTIAVDTGATPVDARPHDRRRGAGMARDDPEAPVFDSRGSADSVRDRPCSWVRAERAHRRATGRRGPDRRGIAGRAALIGRGLQRRRGPRLDAPPTRRAADRRRRWPPTGFTFERWRPAWTRRTCRPQRRVPRPLGLGPLSRNAGGTSSALPAFSVPRPGSRSRRRRSSGTRSRRATVIRPATRLARQHRRPAGLRRRARVGADRPQPGRSDIGAANPAWTSTSRTRAVRPACTALWIHRRRDLAKHARRTQADRPSRPRHRRRGDRCARSSRTARSSPPRARRRPTSCRRRDDRPDRRATWPRAACDGR